MFSASFEAGGAILKKIVEIIKDKEHIPEGVLFVSQDGITLQSMDSSHVALVDLFIRPNAALSFECNNTYRLGINFDALSKIFKCSISTGICILHYDPKEQNDILTITFEGGKKAAFEMKLLDIDSERMNVPETTHECQQIIDALDIQKIIKDMSVFSEDVTISRNVRNLVFTSNGESTNASVELIVAETYTGKYSGQYSLKYLSWFAKASSLCEEALFALDKQQPLLIQFQNDMMCLKFFLASKVSDDELV